MGIFIHQWDGVDDLIDHARCVLDERDYSALARRMPPETDVETLCDLLTGFGVTVIREEI